VGVDLCDSAYGPLIGELREDDELHVSRIFAVGSVDIEGDGAAGKILQLSDALEGTSHAYMVHTSTAIFASFDFCGSRGGYEHSIQIAVWKGRGGGSRNRAGNPPAVNRGRGERETDLGTLRSLRDSGTGFRGVAAEKLSLAIDNHLWRIGIVELQSRSVKVLPLGELRGGKSVAPPLAVPVVDVLLENDDVSVADGLLFL
jgi:hypothetical protein